MLHMVFCSFLFFPSYWWLAHPATALRQNNSPPCESSTPRSIGHANYTRIPIWPQRRVWHRKAHVRVKFEPCFCLLPCCLSPCNAALGATSVGVHGQHLVFDQKYYTKQRIKDVFKCGVKPAWNNCSAQFSQWFKLRKVNSSVDFPSQKFINVDCFEDLFPVYFSQQTNKWNEILIFVCTRSSFSPSWPIV